MISSVVEFSNSKLKDVFSIDEFTNNKSNKPVIGRLGTNSSVFSKAVS